MLCDLRFGDFFYIKKVSNATFPHTSTYTISATTAKAVCVYWPPHYFGQVIAWTTKQKEEREKKERL